jgi:DNA-binding winged helix-turn-helix (wHTH) protein
VGVAVTAKTLTRQGNGAPETRTAKRFVTEAPRFMLGDWLVDVHAHRLERGDESLALEPRLMAVLAELCRRPGEVVSADALLDACWPGEALGDNPVHKVVAGLRRSLQDSATTPRYIETIRKQGYRLLAPIRVLSDQGPRSHQGGWRGQSPFRGLESFGIEHASVFFGRDGAVAELHARLAAQWLRGHPLVVLLGPSGSGKTSLVQAGLLTALLAAPAKADAGCDAARAHRQAGSRPLRSGRTPADRTQAHRSAGHGASSPAVGRSSEDTWYLCTRASVPGKQLLGIALRPSVINHLTSWPVDPCVKAPSWA